jgi:hypothetical protein
MVDLRLLLTTILSSLCLFGCSPSAEEPQQQQQGDLPTANEVLRRSLQFHDPSEAWGKGSLKFVMDEPRIGFAERQSTVVLGMADGQFELERVYDGVLVKRYVQGDSCYSTVDGERVSQADTATIALYRLECERTQNFQRFYRLLNGMPMSLFSPDVSLDEAVTAVVFDEIPCYRLSARLNQSVISEEWFFYFDQRDGRLRGYGYANQDAGEFLRLDGVVDIAGMQLPRMRHWYSRTDSTYLGSDLMVEVSLVD